MNETTFRIRPYSKRELARLYFPETANIDSAVSNLRLWILRNSEVMEKLHGLSHTQQNLHTKAGAHPCGNFRRAVNERIATEANVSPSGNTPICYLRFRKSDSSER